MEVLRTAPVKLSVPDERRDDLHESARQVLHCANRTGEWFCCQKCGYEVNADYNAAKNIGLRYARKRTHRLRSSPTSGGGDAPVDVRVNGGMLNGKSHQPIAGD